MQSLSKKDFNSTLKIAISRGDSEGNYPKYQEWINACESGVELINLYGKQTKEAETLLKNCSALLLSGGNDIHPYYYNKPEAELKCKAIDEKRDAAEFLLILKALELQLPILAICRGMQILNVVLGGTLITDIPSEFSSEINHQKEGDLKDHCFHEISIMQNSLLHAIAKNAEAVVNSYHHQAIEHPSEILKVTATSQDGIIEGIEWKNPEGRPLLLGVQWHPERMNNSNIFSLSIAAAFIDAARDYNGRFQK